MHFFDVFINSYDVFLDGLWITFKLSLASLVIAFFIGLFFAVLKISNIRILEWIADAYIWIVRGTPLIVQIFILFYGLTDILLIPMFWAGVAGLAFHSGAYIAEIIRGAIQSIEKGQREAGRSLGMSTSLTMRRIILPQAFRRAVPSLGNQFIIGIKDSSLVSFIGMQDLFGVASTMGSNSFDYLSYFFTVAVYYLFIVLVLTVLVNRIEKRLAVSD
ncbi:amino acid ABC transporter permease [Virgibacillus halodenitrificans]|uniref:Amino acid ABC transporter permease n=1 Tax=Virgibacillus halodenitrificans TaxID=1482 RepID=A0AAC9NN39_VIRHA|nr:amino acid ABC transporter permease [Virgibacillus halodenitrificans]APC50216.1 cystine transporter permease [Virgibacillus halodenitrificans]MBD1223746.1 amino acid ABC transporter permease [Virgibacillus halodenitrificans]MCG1027885.1 amino acid ABC transporter permease [Virgibacillus halodenitrificans]MEC2159940.1 amino acid ABC transporter permease [Virgibacillus halodenitrificans]MYL44885.1 ABC transporter permease subunit [Virgibacillus halodenitrificans]